MDYVPSTQLQQPRCSLARTVLVIDRNRRGSRWTGGEGVDDWHVDIGQVDRNLSIGATPRNNQPIDLAVKQGMQMQPGPVGVVLNG